MTISWTLGDSLNHWREWANAMGAAAPAPLAATCLARAPTREGDWALDLGCGTGRAFPLLAQRGYRIIGIDPTAEALRSSRSRAARLGLAAWPLQATAEGLPIATARIAFALAFGVLFHLGPHALPQALTELRRVLSPDGIALLHFLDRDDKRRSWQPSVALEALTLAGEHALITSFCSRDWIEEQLRASGLIIQSLELHTCDEADGQRREWIALCRR